MKRFSITIDILAPAERVITLLVIFGLLCLGYPGMTLIVMPIMFGFDVLAFKS